MGQMSHALVWLFQVFLVLGWLLPVRCGAEGTSVTIRNNAPRIDESGKIVDAHDGCLECFDGRFYLYGTRYGESDGFTTANRYVCYSSPDLAHWKFHGEILTDPPEGVYYRPYVKYNSKTRLYVLWYNWYPTLWDGQYGVAVSESPQGPFSIRDPNVKVKYGKPGDHGLLVDDDGTAYLIYTSIEENHGVSIEKLAPDYLSSTGENGGILATGCEACSLFRRDGTYYALFDGCCCFCPAGSGARVYTASAPLGPFTLQGNINRDDTGAVIVPAQQTHVAMIPTTDGTDYIWMGDLWGSRTDGVKGHDLQYWSRPLRFDPKGGIERMHWEDAWSTSLAFRHPPGPRQSEQ